MDIYKASKIINWAAGVATIIGVIYAFLEEAPEHLEEVQVQSEEVQVNGILIKDDVEISGGNFAGRDNNIYYDQKVVIDNGNEEYINLMNFRAKEINENIYKYYTLESVEEYLEKFNKLQIEHVKALENQNLILAHEILGKIHRLSFNLERDERKNIDRINGREVYYETGAEIKQDMPFGKLINKYLSGEYKELVTYDSLQKWQTEAMAEGFNSLK